MHGLGAAGSGAAAPAAAEADGSGEGAAAPYRCPITDLPCDKFPFVALAGCGHVFSERAQREMAAADRTCGTCGAAFEPGEVVPLCGNAEQVAQLREALPERRGRRKKARKGGGGSGGGEKAGRGLAAAAEAPSQQQSEEGQQQHQQEERAHQ